MGRYATVNEVLRDVALEVGLAKETAPFDSVNAAIQQLVGLLDIAGQELVELHEWQILNKKHQITTLSTDTGEYPLPDDYSYMINQTGWDRSNHVPLGGPLSSQIWTYLEGRDLVNQTIYASFRLTEGVFSIFPQPPPDGLNIHFEYISRNWVESAETPGDYLDRASVGADVVLYEPILIKRLLKAKFLESKGFDSSAARAEFDTIFNSRTGKDEGAAILSVSRTSKGYPYLTPYGNTGDTGYGVS